MHHVPVNQFLMGVPLSQFSCEVLQKAQHMSYIREELL